ncbi:MAG: hypothetical protein Q8M94_06325 [Ignavibacteria bacterium]|nr:hypothetical protein [Ignavibacteria bacterium]
MQKLLLFSILLFSIQSNQAQSKIYVGFNLAPSLSFPVMQGSSEQIEAKSNISFGITGAYFFDRNLYLKTAIILNQKSFALNGLPNTIGSLPNGTWDVNDLQGYDSYSTFDDTETYQSLILPLTINYKLSNLDNTSLLFSGGIEIGYLYNVKYVYDFSIGEQRTYNIKYGNIFGALNLGIGLFQPISNNYLLLITPRYSHTFYPKDWIKRLNVNTINSINLDVEFYFQLN